MGVVLKNNSSNLKLYMVTVNRGIPKPKAVSCGRLHFSFACLGGFLEAIDVVLKKDWVIKTSFSFFCKICSVPTKKLVIFAAI
jgi:hypothetical protein